MFNKRSFIRSWICTFTLFLLAVPSLSLVEDFQSQNQSLNRFLIQNKFNGAVSVAKKGVVVFQKAYGIADLEGKIGLTTKSPFNLASVSKQFTATGIMILFQRNLLQLDDPISRYLPQLAYAKGITIRHLLNHTSGLPDVYSFLRTHWDTTQTAGNDVLLKLFRKHQPKLLFKPGEKMQYSNTGYIALASIIETVSKKSFYEFMKKNIFDPLDMKDTYAYYLTMDHYPHPHRVWGLRLENGKTVLNDLIYCDGMRGDGNIHSSLQDLFKWDRALYTEKILKKETLKLMFTEGRLNNGETFPYGFGWGVNKNPRSVSHGGRWVGFRSFVIRYLDTQDTIILLINRVSPNSGNIVQEIKKRYNLK